MAVSILYFCQQYFHLTIFGLPEKNSAIMESTKGTPTNTIQGTSESVSNNVR
jgi:hypothetical protein